MSIILTEILLAVSPLGEAILRNGIYFTPKMSIYSLLILLRVVIIVLSSISLKLVLNPEYLNNIVNYIYRFGIFIILICVLEWITKNLLKSSIFIDIVNIVFGKGESTVDFILIRVGSSTLQGFTREPSHFVSGLFYFIIIVILSDLKTKNVIKALFCVITLFVLSGSFTSVLYILCLTVIWIVSNKMKRVYIYFYLFFFSFLFLIFFTVRYDIFQYYFFRITNSLNFIVTEDTRLLITSEGYRINSIIQTFRILPKALFFGIGLGMPYSYGFLSWILASIGVIGTALWLNFTFRTIGGIKLNRATFYVIMSMVFVWIFSESIAMMYSLYMIFIAINIGYAFNKGM